MDEQKVPSWAPHGKALWSYWQGNTEAAIGIQMKGEDSIEMPMEIYFRREEEMPDLELFALNLCRGKVLDIGAGAGAHSLLLQKQELEVVALDIAPEAVEIMKNRAIKNSCCADFLQLEPTETFDTLLFLMNGIGIAGNLEGLSKYLEHAHALCSADGQILLDSSTLDQPDTNDSNSYYGEIEYQLNFEGLTGSSYQWLYIDPDTLIEIANQCKWHCQIVYEEGDGSYLARLTKK